MTPSLNGRIAFITGAASGMGAATAGRLAGLGATILATDVNGDGACRMVAALGGSSPHRAMTLDVTNAEQWSEIAAEIDRDFGRLDVVHLNAGIMTRPPETPIGDLRDWLDVSSYRKVMAVNVDGVVLGLIATLPLLEATGGGDVIITASTAGLQPLHFDPYYTMSKHALVGLVRSLTGLQSNGLRVNAICPGAIDTGIIPDELRPNLRLSSPSYIADIVVAVLESGRTGSVWVALGEGLTPWLIEPPDLRRAHSGSDVYERKAHR